MPCVYEGSLINLEGMKTRNVYVASDHAGFDLKSYILSQWAQGYVGPSIHWKFIDLGPTTDARVDYPDFAHAVCARVLADKDQSSRGILICGSGQGMAISANRHPGIRAALVWNEESTILSRSHNDANILCVGARLIERDLMKAMLPAFLNTEFEGGRHLGRIQKIEPIARPPAKE